MISVTLNKIAEILHGETFGSNITLNTVTTDTRKINYGCLFIALVGKHFDAHNFATQAKEIGAGALLVNRKLNIDIPQVVVKNTRLAFNELAAWVRQQVPARVVALTGSSGKTSVKEMCAAILSQCGKTLYTTANLNNDIGVSITLLRLDKEHDHAVIELGANRQGEIAWTAGLTRPEAALVNNLSIAHLDGFVSLEGIAKEKGEIYSGLSENGTAIMNGDSNDWMNWKTMIDGSHRIWRFSLNSNRSDFTATNIHCTSCGVKFALHTPEGSTDIWMPLIGLHNISNALAASALATAVGAPLEAIKKGLENFNAIPGRMFPIPLSKNQLIIDDSYNSNVGSMTEAIKVLSQMPGYRVMVTSDIAELGDKSELYHMKIGELVKVSGLDRVLSIGKFSQIISQVSGVGTHFTDKITLVNKIKKLIEENQIITVLVKGSRIASMEEIVYVLKKTYNKGE